MSASERREASRERTGREGRGGVDVSGRPRLLLPASALAPPQAGITSVDEPLRHYRDLFEGAPLAYIVTDAGGRIATFTPYSPAWPSKNTFGLPT